jgi:hypothetical protein
MIITDNAWVWQMPLNFLTNACKHTKEGSIHVNISVCTEYPPGRKVDKRAKTANSGPAPSSRSSSSSHDPQGEQLLFQIVDSGVGVDPRQQDALFAAFSQAQSGQSSGTGLGLFSVYSRCTRLGGACGVISPNIHPISDGEGSTFWFTVPYLPASQQHVEATEFSRYPTAHILCDRCQPADGMVVMGIDTTWSKKEDVLIEQEIQGDSSKARGEDKEANTGLSYTAFVVDDVQSIRKLLKRTLIGLGFTRVELFENGKRALDAMKQEVVDVVFMDIQVMVGTWGVTCEIYK